MKLRCLKCDKTYKLGNYGKCEKCNGILKVEYSDYSDFNKETCLSGIWRYIKYLPIRDKKNIVSLSEGNTPIIKSDEGLYFKMESLNPTGSFKDRGISVMVSKAKEDNIDTMVIASSGNASASLAAYCAKANISAIVYVPYNTPEEKVEQALFYGAKVNKIRGTFTECYDSAEKIAKENGWINATTTFINPYNVQGNKTIAYELYEYFTELPDRIYIPLGAGPVLYGIYDGFYDLKKIGYIHKIPSLVGVQTQECCPIARAFEGHKSVVTAWSGEVSTVATAIADSLLSYADDGTQTLQTIYASKGAAISVSEEDIKKCRSLLAKKEGIFCEASSAVSYAAYKKDLENGCISKDSKVVCIITGHGLKQKTNY